MTFEFICQSCNRKFQVKKLNYKGKSRKCLSCRSQAFTIFSRPGSSSSSSSSSSFSNSRPLSICTLPEEVCEGSEFLVSYKGKMFKTRLMEPLSAPINQETTSHNAISIPLKSSLDRSPSEKDIFNLIQNRQVEAIKKELENGLDITIPSSLSFPLVKWYNGGIQVENCTTALMRASYYGYKEIVELLVKYNVDVNVSTCQGVTALMVAVVKGHKDIVELLLKNNANPNVRTIPSDKETQCNNCRNGCRRCVHFGVSILKKAYDWAYFDKNYDIIELLLKYHANINISLQKHYGTTLLMLASRKGEMNLVKKLLEYNANTTVQDMWGHTALMMAAWGDHLNVVELLLNQSTMDINVQDIAGNTALTKTSDRAIVELILQHSDENIQKAFGSMDLGCCSDAVAETFLQINDIDLNILNRGLVTAATSLNFERVDLLLKHNAKVNIKGYSVALEKVVLSRRNCNDLDTSRKNLDMIEILLTNHAKCRFSKVMEGFDDEIDFRTKLDLGTPFEEYACKEREEVTETNEVNQNVDIRRKSDIFKALFRQDQRGSRSSAY